MSTPSAPTRPPRVLVILPSWLGDTVMSTPTLRLLRGALPGSIIMGLGRPGMRDLLAGDDLLDDVIEADARRLMGPAKVAGRLIPLKLDAALLLPNSFSTAMTVRLAGVPIRVGYDRDARGLLLTHKLTPPKRSPPTWATAGYAPVSAVDYYFELGRCLLGALRGAGWTVREPEAPARPRLELGITDGQDREAREVLRRAGVEEGAPFALLNPGGNNPAKRWPVERFAAAAHHLISAHRERVLINGSPGEREVVALIRDAIVLNHPEDESRIACLTELGITVGALKGVVKRARLMVTNDTGPRHLAAAFGTPCITLFGPTDPRWTTLPPEPGGRAREVVLTADPTLPPSELADEHPRRCAIDRILAADVLAAVDRLLAPERT